MNTFTQHVQHKLLTITSFTKLGIFTIREGFSVSKERGTYRSSNLFLSFLTPISSQWPSSHSLCEALGLFSPSRALVSDRHCGVVCERGVSFSLRWAEASSVLNSSSQSFHPAAQRLPAGDFLWKGSLSVWFLQQHFWWIIQNWRSCPGLGGLFFSQKHTVAQKNIWKLKSHVKIDETWQKHTQNILHPIIKRKICIIFFKKQQLNVTLDQVYLQQ